jgi:hypothetical protein
MTAQEHVAAGRGGAGGEKSCAQDGTARNGHQALPLP